MAGAAERPGLLLDCLGLSRIAGRQSMLLQTTLEFSQRKADIAAIIMDQREVFIAAQIGCDRLRPVQRCQRHRAAIGVTEESDAVVVITSEETGTISLVWNGELRPQEDTVKTEETLNRLLAGEDVE